GGHGGGPAHTNGRPVRTQDIETAPLRLLAVAAGILYMLHSRLPGVTTTDLQDESSPDRAVRQSAKAGCCQRAGFRGSFSGCRSPGPGARPQPPESSVFPSCPPRSFPTSTATSTP